jgi:sugar phosphate isomerase/epimerase
MYSRRAFGKIALGALPFAAALAKINSTIKGVRLGLQTYSFRDFAADKYADLVIKNMSEIGLGECELQFPRGPAVAARAQPADKDARKAAAKEARKRALATPIDFYRGVGSKFKDAGIEIHIYNSAFGRTDEELDREFEIAKALGAQMIASSTTVTMAKRVVPFAEKHKMVVAFHGHSNITDPDEFATPQSFAAALDMSKYYRTNLDIGHFTAAGYDSVAYIREHHDKITHLHLKDRKKDQGPNTLWGQGDTPIKQVLQLLKEKKYPIPAYIEYEYKGTGSSPEEVKQCFDFVKAALA